MDRHPRGVRVGLRASLRGLLAIAALGIGPGLEASASPLRIMPLGDSITYGLSTPADVPGGYRGRLYSDLASAGFDPQFVGSQTSNPDPNLPDAARAHEGHSGYQIDGIGSYRDSSLNGHIDQWLAPGNGVDPDDILLMIGANSILGQYHTAGAPYELAALVARISELRPNAKILVSTLSPQGTAYYQGQVEQFNRTLGGPDGLIAQLRGLGKNVRLVDVGGALTASDLSDYVHPTKAGYEKLGDAWFRAILDSNATPVPEPSTFALLALGIAAWSATARSQDGARRVRQATSVLDLELTVGTS